MTCLIPQINRKGTPFLCVQNHISWSYNKPSISLKKSFYGNNFFDFISLWYSRSIETKHCKSVIIWSVRIIVDFGVHQTVNLQCSFIVGHFDIKIKVEIKTWGNCIYSKNETKSGSPTGSRHYLFGQLVSESYLPFNNKICLNYRQDHTS